MVIISKNGVRLDISPRRWWNILDLIAWINEIRIFKKTDVFINTENWKFETRTCE